MCAHARLCLTVPLGRVRVAARPNHLSADHDSLPLDCQIQRKVADLAIRHERFVNY